MTSFHLIQGRFYLRLAPDRLPKVQFLAIYLPLPIKRGQAILSFLSLHS